MASEQTGTIESARGLELHWHVQRPEGEPIASLLIVHGYAEHMGRYDNVRGALVPEGVEVWGLDLQGHGLSGGKRAYVERLSHFVEDLHQLYEAEIAPTLGGRKLFLLGHSMGSVIAMHYAKQHEAELAGLILSGSGSTMAGTPPILTALAKVLSALVPRLGIKSPFPNDFISHDPEVVKAYGEDPLVFAPHLTIRLGAEMYQGCLDGAAGLRSLGLPLLLQYGSLDVSFAGQQELFERYAGADKTIHCYEGAKHECYNELPEWKDRALGDLSGWVLERVGVASA